MPAVVFKMKISENKNYLRQYPKHIISALARQGQRLGTPIFFAGGPVRDWLLGRRPTDLDITIPDNSALFARALAKDICGTMVPLSEAEGVFRVVSDDLWLDISSFRDETLSINEDLKKRDFTINAMAVLFNSKTKSIDPEVIDPTSGMNDLHTGIIRVTSHSSFSNDPLRMLRAFRFSASFNYKISSKSQDLIRQNAKLIEGVAGERLTAEFDKIMSCNNADKTIKQMVDTELLWHIFPDLHAGVGMQQPPSHHLDVFEHNLEALRQMGEIIAKPDKFFPECATTINSYLDCKRKIIQLRLTALLHDIGKPATFKIRNGRRTFYNHDQIGVKKISQIAKRLKWSIVDRNAITLLIKHHMRPFHLLNARSKSKLSNKAYLKLIKAANGELIGLFLLAMADSLAGCGSGKPIGMEENLAAFFNEMIKFSNAIKPILNNPKLINGRDLIALGQEPGPDFNRFFQELELRQIDSPGMTQKDALQFAAVFFKT